MEAMAIIDEYRELDRRSKLLHPIRHIRSSPSARWGVDRPLKIDHFNAIEGSWFATARRANPSHSPPSSTVRMVADEYDIWILRVKLLEKRPRPGNGGLSVSGTEVSLAL